MRKIIPLVLWLAFSFNASADALLPSVPVPQTGNSQNRVNNWIDFYQRRSDVIDEMFTQTREINTMVSILGSHGIPSDLVCLSMAESELDAYAYNSESGARGCWQFIPSTARRYGLRVDRTVDERCDLVKSTHAAARYLLDLYQKFGNWHLVIAGYNWGEGNFNGSIDYWGYGKNQLPDETWNHVPRVLAILQIARDRGLFTGKYVPEPEFTKRIIADSPRRASTHRRIDGNRANQKRLLALISQISENPDGYKKGEVFSNSREMMKTHRVKAGESLLSISRKYHVTTYAVWKLNPNPLREGMLIKIP